MSIFSQAAPRLSASAPVESSEQAHSSSEDWDRIALSFEVHPPRGHKPEDLAALDNILDTIGEYHPDYICVTSSKSSGWLEGTSRVIEYINSTTHLRPVAHVACTTGPKEELEKGITSLIDAGVRGILALRGDLPEGQTRLPDGYLQHATELIRLIRDIEGRQAARFAAGGLAVGVASYPAGHAESASEDEDYDVLAAKQRMGANFAITQLFFDPADYGRFVEKARLAGITIPLIPGIMPMTSLDRMERIGHLSGLEVPASIRKQMTEAAARGPEAEHAAGMDLTVQLARACLEQGAGGLHIYTYNNVETTRELLTRIGVMPGHKSKDGIVIP